MLKRTCKDVGYGDVDGWHNWIEQDVEELWEKALLAVMISIAARCSLHRRLNFHGMEIYRMMERPIGEYRQRRGFDAEIQNHTLVGRREIGHVKMAPERFGWNELPKGLRIEPVVLVVVHHQDDGLLRRKSSSLATSPCHVDQLSARQLQIKID